MKNYISIAISLVLVSVIGYMLMQKETAVPPSSGNSIADSGSSISSNVTVKDGVQYITVNAKGGYFPRNSVATANMPTKLIMKTDNTYDCSSSFVVRATGFRGMLPATGETVIDIPSKEPGEKLQASCGMGMYHMDIDFQ